MVQEELDTITNGHTDGQDHNIPDFLRKHGDNKSLGWYYPPIELFGWKIENSKLSVIWDSEDNLSKTQKCIKLWTSGCGCQKSFCANNQCGCKKNGRFCGPICKCGSGCTNKGSSLTNSTENATDGQLSQIMEELELDEHVSDQEEHVSDQEEHVSEQATNVLNCETSSDEDSDESDIE